ncbi:MAG TPA: hypothetical protein VEH79_00175 [Gaiellaceae bacterium]|nr:hypothetical protein [Gaiellaceae bacterium]
MALLRRRRGATSVEDEREALRSLQQAAAQQLEAMKHELAERVGAVRERELELEAALSATPNRPAAGQTTGSTLAAQGQELRRREHELPARAALPSRQDAAERERIEQRLAELHEAERMFLLTRDELSARSEAVAARERLIAERERELAQDGAGTMPPSLPELADLEVRLRRLESGGQAADDSRSFAAGLESLRRRGTRRQT